MLQIHLQLTDQLYNQAKRRADEAGFKSVDDYVADVLTNDLKEDIENLDHLFTAESLPLIDEADAQIKAGQCHTLEETRAHLATKRTEWIKKNNP